MQRDLNMKNSVKLLVLVCGLLFASSIFTSTWRPSTSAQTVESNGFALINSIWGTTSAPVEAGPGSQDVPLTITLQYLYAFPSVSAEFEIKLPTGVTSTASSVTGQDDNNATAFYVNRLDQGQIFQITLYLNLANSTSLGVFTFPSTIFWYAILSNSTSQPEVYLQQDLNLEASLNGNSKLSYSTSDTALTPNKINNVTFTLTNSGSGNVTDISTTVSGSSAMASILNELPSSLSLAAGSSLNETLQVFVPQSAAGSIFALNFVTTYLDSYQNQESVTQSLGFFVNSLNSINPLTYTLSDTSLTPGGVNNLTMTLTNTGTATLTSISTVVSVPVSAAAGPGVSVVSQPISVSNLASGASVT